MSAEVLPGAFRNALRARRFEERVTQLSLSGEIPATLHPGAGQEVEQCAALAALGPGDQVLYGHRGIAYMLARGTSMAAILADIANREGGTNNGKGGVMHIVDPAHGVLGESGTLGGGFVIATGVGMALKRRGKGDVVVHFFGDGTSNRGTFHESLNWSAVQKLPIIYFCENNGWAVSVPASRSTAVADISSRAAGYGVPGVVVDGNDAVAVYEVMQEAVARARRGAGPSLIEAKVNRMYGHFVGDPQAYRPDRDEAMTRDPLPRFQQALIDSGAIDEKGVTEMEAEIADEIAEAVRTVLAAPLIPVSAAFEDLYVTAGDRSNG